MAAALRIFGREDHLVLSPEEVLEHIVVAFPSILPPEEVTTFTYEPDYGSLDCVESLLRVAWRDLEHTQLVFNRNCDIYLTPEQTFYCLPAFLYACVSLLLDDPSHLLFECETFLKGALHPQDGKLMKLTNRYQRLAIAMALELVAERAAALEEFDESDELLWDSWWWMEQAGKGDN